MQRCNLNIAGEYEYIFIVVLKFYSDFYIHLISVVNVALQHDKRRVWKNLTVPCRDFMRQFTRHWSIGLVSSLY